MNRMLLETLIVLGFASCLLVLAGLLAELPAFTIGGVIFAVAALGIAAVGTWRAVRDRHAQRKFERYLRGLK
jgi:hypothetical protein